MSRRRRACTYITDGSRLLVFDHVDHPEAGTQVPGGTVKAGELPKDAALREAAEETGLTDLRVQSFLGRLTRDMSDYGADEVVECWFFHLTCPPGAPERWRHDGTCGDSSAPIRFEHYWVDLARGVPHLIALNGKLVGVLRRHVMPQGAPESDSGRAGGPLPGEVTLRPASGRDREFAFLVKESAFGDYVDRLWGWDDAAQRKLHERRYGEQTFELIERAGVDVGYCAVLRRRDCIHLNQLYVLPAHQGNGLGEHVVTRYQSEGARRRQSIRLHVLKINTGARSFYERLGFLSIGTSEHHIHMEWSP